MENLWKVSSSKSMKSPYAYVKQQCNYLGKVTENKLVGRIKEYYGEYKSFNSLKNSSSLYANPFQMIDDKFDVQDELGDNDSQFVYEFYITLRNSPNYKYRIFFVAYGISIYPTFISLEKSIADELKCETEFYIDNEEQFKAFLKAVLCTDRISFVISNLLSLVEK